MLFNVHEYIFNSRQSSTCTKMLTIQTHQFCFDIRVSSFDLTKNRGVVRKANSHASSAFLEFTQSFLRSPIMQGHNAAVTCGMYFLLHVECVLYFVWEVFSTLCGKCFLLYVESVFYSMWNAFSTYGEPWRSPREWGE